MLILYTLLFITTVGFALGVLLNKNTVKSAICLVGVMASLAVNYLMMGMEFVAFIQIIVYAGAIMVLFLFVIMLLNLRENETTPWYLRSARFWGGALGILFFGCVAYAVFVFAPTTQPEAVAVQEQIQLNGTPEVILLSTVMITKYIVPFLLTSVLLLVAVIGAIVMARRKDEDGLEIVIEEDQEELA